MLCCAGVQQGSQSQPASDITMLAALCGAVAAQSDDAKRQTFERLNNVSNGQ